MLHRHTVAAACSGNNVTQIHCSSSLQQQQCYTMLHKYTAATHDALGALVPPRDVGANDFGKDEESEAGV